jgi:serine phosphatase RsbU (regulator of sigma subunit)
MVLNKFLGSEKTNRISEEISQALAIDIVNAWEQEYRNLGDKYATWGAIMVVFLFPLAVLPELQLEKDNVYLWAFFRFSPSIIVGITYLLYRKFKFSHEWVFEILALCIFASGAYRVNCADWMTQMISNISLFITAAILTVLRPPIFILNFAAIVALNIGFFWGFCDRPIIEFWTEPSTPIFLVTGIAAFAIAILRYYNLKNNFQQRLALISAYEELKNTNKNLVDARNELLIKNNQILEQNEELLHQTEEISSQRDALEEQNSKIEMANADIMSSINYAVRIQGAILPSDELFVKHFSEHFIFFKPRDIVSGDFYWAGMNNEYFIFAAIDCTGHGVPGALMSVLANSMLNNIVLQEGITSPAEILHKMDEALEKTFKNKKTGTSDGFDVAICTYHMPTKTLYFSGANHPILLFRDGEKQLIKGDRTGIGGFRLTTIRFEEHKLLLQANDSFYLFSDGFQDQFGGKRDQKYLRKRFVDFVTSLHHLPLQDQLAALDIELRRWMSSGSHGQIDDILVMGFKI